MKKDDFMESKKRRDAERNAALQVYVMWAWIERKELKALEECTYIDRGEIKSEYPLYTELGYYGMMGTCPWCEVYTVGVTKDTEDREDDHCFQTKCGGCPLNLTGNCCDGMKYALWRKWRFSEGNKNAICAGEIAALAWKIYKSLGG